jgi:hypothetical protein
MCKLTTTATLIVAAGLAAACLGTGEDRVLGIDATGSVFGFAYFDSNGNGELDAADVALAGVELRLLPSGSPVPLFSATSDADGLIRLVRIDVGSYSAEADPGSAGDSAQVVEIDPDSLSVTPNDSLTITVAVSFASASVEEARGLPGDERVFVEGIALNSRTTFGDNTVHLAGATAAIRVTGVRSGSIFPGDSVRVLGTTSSLDGQPVLGNGSVFVLAPADEPTAEVVTAAIAAAADGGRLDAGLVRVDSVTVADTATVAGGFQLDVDDASGALTVLLDEDAPITDPAQYEPGTVLEVSGLLIPDGAGVWVLKPRSEADLAVQ